MSGRAGARLACAALLLAVVSGCVQTIAKLKGMHSEVVDRTGIQGSVGSREAVVKGEADAGFEYTGTAWITYQGNSRPIPDPHEQWLAVRDADKKNGVTWLEPSELNNTYALAMNQANYERFHTRTLSEVAELS